MLKTLMWTLNLPDLMLNDFSIYFYFIFFGSFKTVLKQRNIYIACKFIVLTFWRYFNFCKYFYDGNTVIIMMQ